MQGKFDAAIAQRQTGAASAEAIVAPLAPKPASLLPPAAAAVVQHEQQQAAAAASKTTQPMRGLPFSPLVAAAVAEGPSGRATAGVEEA